jgi:hypothetical protein
MMRTLNFFHSIATIAHKRNFIVSLINQEGDTITDHDQKASLLWTAYKERLGVSEFRGISYDLGELLSEHSLKNIGDDFGQDEIDLIIKSLPNNHVPSPNGFNGLFIKKCWNILKNDFNRLMHDFCYLNTNLTSTNSSVIALIPKKDNPKRVDDFRPISVTPLMLRARLAPRLIPKRNYLTGSLG